MLRTIALIAAIWLSLSPALATPPRIANIDDTLFASNETHIFVLRRVTDNMGNHFSMVTDVSLIAINLSTGEIDNSWRVLGVRDFTEHFADFEKPDRYEHFDSENRVNPFEIVLEQGVYSIMPHEGTFPEDQMHRGENSFTLTDRDGDVTYRLTFEETASRIASVISDTRRLMPAQDVPNEPDPLSEAVFDVATMCEIGNRHGYRPAIVRLDCSDLEYPIRVSFYTIMPSVADADANGM